MKQNELDKERTVYNETEETPVSFYFYINYIIYRLLLNLKLYRLHCS